MNALDYLNVSPVVPVVVLEDTAHALPLAQALLDGGINIMEITLRSEAALASIELIAREVPEMHVGAGTVINREQMLMVQDAGGKFSFSPGMSDELLETSSSQNIAFIPGIATASELMKVIDAGLQACKLFPASAVGGVELLKGFSGPFKQVMFCPTGGIHLENMNDYLSLANVACVGGSWIVPKTSMTSGDFSHITELCRGALEQVKS